VRRGEKMEPMVNVEIAADLEQDKGIKKVKSYRWFVWGILVLAYVIVFFHRLSMGVIRPDLINTFGIGDKDFANISTTYFYIYLFMQIPTGMFVDSVGPRKTAASGLVISALGSIIFGLTPSIIGLYIGRSLIGLGVSVIFVSILKIQAMWFYRKEFATITGITCLIGTMGGVLAQSPLAKLVSVLTWRYSFVAVSVVTVIIALLILKYVKNSPMDMGLPLLEHYESSDDKITFKKLSKDLVKVLKNPKTWFAFFLYAGCYGSYVIITGFWGTAYITDVYGLNLLTASNYIIAAVIGSALGALSIGWVSDKMQSRKKPMIAFSGIYLASWLSLVFWNGGKMPIQALPIVLFILGYTSAAFVITWAVGKEVNSPETVGISTSVVNIGGFLGSIIVPPFMGNVFDLYSNVLTPVELYHKAFIFALAASLFAFVVSFFTTETNCENISSKN
jgi:sugar phosphate permease